MKLLHGEIDADFQLDFCLPERRLLSRHFQFKNLKVFINCMLFVIGNEDNASKLHRLRKKEKIFNSSSWRSPMPNWEML